MSAPISICLIAKAAKLEPGARPKLVERMEYNKNFGGFSVYPCCHEPRCTDPSFEQLAHLVAEIPTIGPVIESLVKEKGAT